MLLNSKEIPKGYSAYGHQVAGHRFETGNEGMLLDCDGKLLKPIQAPPRGKQEVEFYQTVFGQKTLDPALAKLQQFVPTFYGIKHIVSQDVPLEDQADKYIVLENLTRDFHKPCILDVKIGKCVTDHLATQAKRERSARKYPELEKFGFRILGMKIFSRSCKDYKFHDKSFGKNLKTPTDVLAGLKEFLQEDDYGTTHIEEILEHLKAIKFWALDQRILRLYSSSVLIIYEGGEGCNSNNVEDASHHSSKDNQILDSCLKQSLKCDFCNKETAVANTENEETCNMMQNLSLEVNGLEESQDMHDSCIKASSKPQKRKVSIHLVDFAHTYIGHYKDPDENYIYGLCNLIDYFEEIIKTSLSLSP